MFLALLFPDNILSLPFACQLFCMLRTSHKLVRVSWGSVFPVLFSHFYYNSKRSFWSVSSFLISFHFTTGDSCHHHLWASTPSEATFLSSDTVYHLCTKAVPYISGFILIASFFSSSKYVWLSVMFNKPWRNYWQKIKPFFPTSHISYHLSVACGFIRRCMLKSVGH